MGMYSYSQNRHADPADVSANMELRVNDLRVRAASAKAAERTHGRGTQVCIDCDAKIDEKRKEALPAATRCAPCQRDQDHLESIPGYGRLS